MSRKRLIDPRGDAYELGWSYMRGELSRRAFLRRAAALSLSAPVVSAMLAGARPAVAIAQDMEVNEDVSGEISTISNTGPGAESVAWNERIDAFEALHPNVTVKRDERVGETYYTTSEAALRQIAGGVPPDTLRAGDYFAAQLASRGALLPLDEFIANDPDLDYEDFLQSARDSFTYDGVVYALPENAETYGVNYNRTAFQDAGLPDPREQWEAGEWTNEQFLESSKALSSGEGTEKKFGAVFETWNSENWIFNGGGRVLSDDLQVMIDQPEAYSGLQFAADLANVHGAAPNPLQYTPERGPLAQFEDGTAAQYLIGGWLIANFVSQIADFEYMTAGMPIGDGGKTSKVEISSYAILNDSPNPEAAWEYIKFITGPAGQRIWTVVATPTRQSILDEFVSDSNPLGEWYAPFAETLPNAHHSPFWERSAEIAQILTEGQADIFLGTVDAESRAAAMADEMRKVVSG